MTVRTNRVVLLLLAIFSSAFISFAPLMTYTAQAASEDPGQQLDKWLYYRGMRACLEKPWFGDDGTDNEDISVSDINDGQLKIYNWGTGGNQNEGFGYLAPDMDNGDDGTVDCSDGSIWVRGATIFGFENVLELVCAMNQNLPSGEGGRITPSHPTDCEKSEQISFDGGSGAFQAALTGALENAGSKDRPRFDISGNGGPDYSYRALLYLMGKRSLETFCGNGASLESGSSDGGDIGSPEIVSVDIVKLNGSTVTVDKSQPYALADADRNEDSEVDDVFYNNNENEADDLKCHEMARYTREYSADYAAWVTLHPELFEQSNGDGGDGGGVGANEAVCSAGALGWIFCPLTEFISDATKTVAEMLEGRLVYPALLESDQGKAIRAVWGTVLGIANLGLAIAFLIVIFSQATSVGLSSYGIKKVLPRVVAAAIMMNLSFFVCAIAVDLANILGVSIKSIVEAGVQELPATPGVEGASYSWSTTLIAILGVGLAVITGAIALLLPVLMMAFIAVLTALLVIAAREVIITLLIIVAPIAFLAWILPNTEQWFTKWRKLFTTMLLMFPLVMLIFYGSLLVSKLILVTADGGDDGAPDLMVNVIALAVLTIPLFSLPFIMKSAGGLLDRLGVITNNRSKGLVDRSRKIGQESFGRTRSKAASNYDPERKGLSKLKNARARAANRPFLGVTRDQRSRASFTLAQRGDQYEGEQTKLAAATLSQKGITGDKYALYDIAKNQKNNKFLRRAAALQMAENGAADKLEDLFSGEADPSTGVRSGRDTETRRMTAYAIGVHAGKLASPANPLFFEAVTYESEMKKGQTEAAASAKGADVRQQKVTSQMGSGYLANLKADQITGARKTIQAISDPGQRAAAISSAQTAIQTISTDPRQLNNMTDEQVIEIGKTVDRLGISTATLGPALRTRYISAANAALSAHASGSKPIPAGEMPTTTGW